MAARVTPSTPTLPVMTRQPGWVAMERQRIPHRPGLDECRAIDLAEGIIQGLDEDDIRVGSPHQERDRVHLAIQNECFAHDFTVIRKAALPQSITDHSGVAVASLNRAAEEQRHTSRIKEVVSKVRHIEVVRLVSQAPVCLVDLICPGDFLQPALVA